MVTFLIRLVTSGINATNGLLAHEPHFANNWVALTRQIMISLRHKFAHSTTAEIWNMPRFTDGFLKYIFVTECISGLIKFHWASLFMVQLTKSRASTGSSNALESSGRKPLLDPIPPWIRNCSHYKMWYEITHPFPKKLQLLRLWILGMD